MLLSQQFHQKFETSVYLFDDFNWDNFSISIRKRLIALIYKL